MKTKTHIELNIFYEQYTREFTSNINGYVKANVDHVETCTYLKDMKPYRFNSSRYSCHKTLEEDYNLNC